MKRTLIWLTIFSIAMGFMESAVVIYLREIYYPDGFRFPLAPIEARIGLVELFREAATIIMLVGIGILAGNTASLRFAYFLLCFAIWDLFYYVFLYVFLGWPESLLTWDILFLIPIPWVGPVLTPCIVSVTMLILSFTIIHFHRSGVSTKLIGIEWFSLIIGSLVIIVSFVWDYCKFINMKATEMTKSISKNEDLLSELKDYIPGEFNWTLFFVGELILILTIILFIKRLKGKIHVLDGLD